MDINKCEIYKVVLPSKYTAAFCEAEVFDNVWVDLRKRAVKKALKEHDLHGVVELPPGAPEWVEIVECDSGNVLAVVRVEEFMRN